MLTFFRVFVFIVNEIGVKKASSCTVSTFTAICGNKCDHWISNIQQPAAQHKYHDVIVLSYELWLLPVSEAAHADT